ncbi:hypothetical protein H310_01069 [Aphanomyces invadans]|uniref:Uncharacterized protein n=1 Tax=Aphanomyces invadans TaxID=157072 RepID=A0A024UQE6_9STRA|nr:hypothetical protein H310_01069 [Aphanomyces invadans]ETW08504.1 hypothetical protein H310_01069 [Aphanomyces invadans]|eukprot:XP_008862309.1 hypothetical protein H310_01069 [Aphanomyces invadans]
MDVAGGSSPYKDLDDIFGEDDQDGLAPVVDAMSNKEDLSSDSVHSQPSVGEVEPEDKPTSPDVALWAAESKPSTPPLVIGEETMSVVDDDSLTTPNTSLPPKEFQASESLEFLDYPPEANPTAMAHSQSTSLSFLDMDTDFANPPSHTPSDSMNFLDLTDRRGDYTTGYVEAPLSPFSQFLSTAQTASSGMLTQPPLSAVEHGWNDNLDVAASTPSPGGNSHAASILDEAHVDVRPVADEELRCTPPASEEAESISIEASHGDVFLSENAGILKAAEHPSAADRCAEAAPADEVTSACSIRDVHDKVGATHASYRPDLADTEKYAENVANDGSAVLDGSQNELSVDVSCNDSLDPSAPTSDVSNKHAEINDKDADYSASQATEVVPLEERAQMKVSHHDASFECGVDLTTTHHFSVEDDLHECEEHAQDDAPQPVATYNDGVVPMLLVEDDMHMAPTTTTQHHWALHDPAVESSVSVDNESTEASGHEESLLDSNFDDSHGETGVLALPVSTITRASQDLAAFDFPSLDASTNHNAMQEESISTDDGKIDGERIFPANEGIEITSPDIPSEICPVDTPAVVAIGGTVSDVFGVSSACEETIPRENLQDCSSECEIACASNALSFEQDSPHSLVQLSQESYSANAVDADIEDTSDLSLDCAAPSEIATTPDDFVVLAPHDVAIATNVMQSGGGDVQSVADDAPAAPSSAVEVPSDAFTSSPPVPKSLVFPVSAFPDSTTDASAEESSNSRFISRPTDTLSTAHMTKFQTAPPPSSTYNPFEVLAQEELKSATAFPWLNFQSAPVQNDNPPIDTNNPWASATPDTDDLDGFVSVPTSTRAAIINVVATQATTSWLDVATSQVATSTSKFRDADGERESFGAFEGESPAFSDISSSPQAPCESFGDFSAATTTPAEFGDFGDFSSAAISAVESNDGFSDFGAPLSTTFGGDDDFGEFESSPPADAMTSFGDFTSVQAPSSSMSTVPFDDEKVATLFAKAFPVPARTAPSIPSSSITTQQILGSVDFENTQKPIVCTSLLDVLVKDIHANHVQWDARTSSVREESAHVLEQCKAALAQKVNEAVLHHALFTEKSPEFAEYQSLVHTADKAAMLAGLRKLQLDIFDDMSNKATLSMAEQAALSAQATIASHAQHHKEKVPGLKFQFAWSSSKDKSDHDDRAASTRVLTPTGASISKLHRNSFSNLHASMGTAGGTVSEGEHTSGSDGDGESWETASATSDGAGTEDHHHHPPSRTGSGSLAGSISGTGLMKKLSSKLGFSSLRSSLSLTSTKTKVTQPPALGRDVNSFDRW